MATVYWYRWEKLPHGGRRKVPTAGARRTIIATGKVPTAGARRTIIATGVSDEEARAICERWNANNNPGLLSRKAEYEY